MEIAFEAVSKFKDEIEKSTMQNDKSTR